MPDRPNLGGMSDIKPDQIPAAPVPGVIPAVPPAPALPPEVGGAEGPEPTRYGDWSHKGRCTDF